MQCRPNVSHCSIKFKITRLHQYKLCVYSCRYSVNIEACSIQIAFWLDHVYSVELVYHMSCCDLKTVAYMYVHKIISYVHTYLLLVPTESVTEMTTAIQLCPTDYGAF